jgi:SagB-type dehydrogenase family enzyme
MPVAVPEFQLSLAANARLDQSEDGFRISTCDQEFRFRAPVPALSGALSRLAESGATENALCQQAVQSGEMMALYSLIGVLRTLDSRGALQRHVVLDGRPLARLVPTARQFRFRADGGVCDTQQQLSQFAHIRSDGGSLIVESPLGRARVELLDAAAASLLFALAQPRSFNDLERLFPALAGGPLIGLLILLHNAAVLNDELSDRSWWQFHDLLFHMRSRRGRHDAGYGGTYPHKTAAPPPLIKPAGTGDIIPLEKPDLDQLRRTDPPCADVMERRRSERCYGSEPLTIQQLGEFLYRTVRYQGVMADDRTQYALRPAPSGGALQELEVYAVVARCGGLEPGVYHYRPSEHALTRVALASPQFEHLIEQAWVTADRKAPVQVLFEITARANRVFWKYESMAYALILKNVGALYATMYFAATAMNLAPCALGGGDSELFASIAGLDPCGEPNVGEYLLGSRAES